MCPVTKTSLVYEKDREELWCRASGLAYPIRDGIPVMLEDEGRVSSHRKRSAGSAADRRRHLAPANRLVQCAADSGLGTRG